MTDSRRSWLRLLLVAVLVLAWPSGERFPVEAYSEQAEAERRERWRAEIEAEFLASEARLKAWWEARR